MYLEKSIIIIILNAEQLFLLFCYNNILLFWTQSCSTSTKPTISSHSPFLASAWNEQQLCPTVGGKACLKPSLLSEMGCLAPLPLSLLQGIRIKSEKLITWSSSGEGGAPVADSFWVKKRKSLAPARPLGIVLSSQDQTWCIGFSCSA